MLHAVLPNGTSPKCHMLRRALDGSNNTNSAALGVGITAKGSPPCSLHTTQHYTALPQTRNEEILPQKVRSEG